MTMLIEALKAGRPMRSFAVGSVLSATFVAGVQYLAAQAIAGHNSKAPVTYAGDRIEPQDKQSRVVLSGKVHITQAELTLRAARTTVAYTDAGSLQIQPIDAMGGVVITPGKKRASGDVAVDDFNRKIVSMAGDVALRRRSNTHNGGRLVIDLNAGISNIDGRSSSSAAVRGAAGDSTAASHGGIRVSGSFSVPQQ